MADDKAEKPKTVKVKTLEAHTAFGKSYDVDDVYEIDEQFVDSVEAQGKAVRVEHAPAKPAAKGHPVEPMTSHDVHGKPKK